MDFHRAFNDIDEDGCGEITRQDLEHYMRRMNYQETFVQKWLNLFDIDHNGTITYEEYCTTLGLVPKPDVVERAKRNQAEGRKPETKPRKRAGTTRNSAISRKGLMRFSRARVLEKKSLYRFKPATVRSTRKNGAAGKKSHTQGLTITKPISGAKNGESREVPTHRSARSMPTQEGRRKKAARGRTSLGKDHKRRIRGSLKPGAVLILLSGRQRGKRVVLLKVLESGLLVVTGPYKLNGCPLRRVHQNYVIATSTRVDLSNAKLPSHLNDLYFRRAKTQRQRGSKEDGDIFKKEKPTYELTEQRKKDQKQVDTQILEAVGSHKEAKILRQYLRTSFGLRRSDRPHQMVF